MSISPSVLCELSSRSAADLGSPWIPTSSVGRNEKAEKPIRLFKARSQLQATLYYHHSSIDCGFPGLSLEAQDARMLQ